MPQTKHFRSTVNLGEFLAKESGLPEEVLVLPMGKWNTLPYGVMEVSEASIDQMIANFESGVRKDVPVDVDHDGGKAAGWVKKLKKTADGMVATVEWTPFGEGLLKNKEYKLFSPEWSFEYLDPLTSAAHGATFIAGTLTNRPLFKQLPNLVANEQSALTKDSEVVLVLAGEQIMQLEELLKKPVAELTAEEKAFIVEHQAELTEEQKETFKEVLVPAETEEVKDESTEAVQDEQSESESEADATESEETSTDSESDKAATSTDDTDGAADAATTDTTVVTATEENVTITASELARFKALEAQQTRQAMESKVDKFVANEKGGSILPKNKEAWVNFLLKCSESQQSEVLDLLAKLPQHKIAGEVSDTAAVTATSEDFAKQIDTKAKALMANEPKLTLSAAYKKVLASEPGLVQEYEDAV